jgi:hypothetical protein
VPHQEAREGKGEGRIRSAPILPPSRGDTKEQHPTRGTGYHRPKKQTCPCPNIDTADADHQEPIADWTRTEEDQCGNRR